MDWTPTPVPGPNGETRYRCLSGHDHVFMSLSELCSIVLEAGAEVQVNALRLLEASEDARLSA